MQAPQPMQACNSGISRNISSLLRRLLRSMSIARGGDGISEIDRCHMLNPYIPGRSGGGRPPSFRLSPIFFGAVTVPA